jgi:hypothetical protein
VILCNQFHAAGDTTILNGQGYLVKVPMGTLPAAPRQMRIRDEPKDATAMRGQDRLEFRRTVNFSLKDTTSIVSSL